MEALLNQSRAMCPFLKRTSPAALRSLSTATRPSPGGGTISNLQTLARRCPVMNKALAVQSARLATSKRFPAAARRAYHTTGGQGASVQAGSYRKNERGRSLLHTH